MDDKLCLTKQGLLIDDCLAKVERYCRYYAFPDYDLVGRRYAMENSILRTELLDAMNSAMLARSPREAWQPFLNKPFKELEAVPTDIDLVHSSDKEYMACRIALGVCYQHLIRRSGITDMAATKMLFLKRPNLIAISDSYVREALGIHGVGSAERGLAVADAVREVGQLNLAMLSELQSQIFLSATYTISKARLIDIIIWSYMTQNGRKIQKPKIITWTKNAAQMKQVHTGVIDGDLIYRISLCQQRDRYVVEIDGEFVTPDEKKPIDDGKGAINVICPGNRRGWYFLKDAQAFCKSHAQQ